jgi:hypothetical protein
MAHRKVSIYLYGKTRDGIWKYLKPAIGTNNKIRPGYGVLHGTATKLDKGYRYVLNVSGKWIATGSGLILGLSLPPLLSAPDDVARTSAAMFTISYAGAVAVALIGGAAWDLLGVLARHLCPSPCVPSWLWCRPWRCVEGASLFDTNCELRWGEEIACDRNIQGGACVSQL